MPHAHRLLYAIPSYEYLAAALARAGAYEPGRLERKSFADGERYLRILDDPRGRDVVLLGGTPSDAAALELFDLGCGLFREGARTLSIVMPYFGYSTMERALRRGEVVTAKTRAQLISAIPPCEGGTRVVLFDLHTEGIEFYFSDSHVTHHVHGTPLVSRIASELCGNRPYVLGATDAGRAKWVESLARRLHCEPAFVYKRRDPESGELAVTGINADVKDRMVLIYDDMIRTGSSLLQASTAYHDAGASEVHAIASHLVLPGDALDKLLSSGLIASVNGTNSHPASVRAGERGGRIECVAPLLAAAVERA